MEKEKEKNQEKPAPTVNGKSKQRRLLRKKAKARAVVGDARSVVGGDNLSSLPPPFQNKLQGLFMQIEKEFERLHNQNNALHEKLEVLTEKYESLINCNTASNAVVNDKTENKMDPVVAMDSVDGGKGIKKQSASSLMSQKIKTRYKASTSKLVSSFKIPNTQGGNVYCHMVQKYLGHRDGIWDVCSRRSNQPVLGTASADRTARIWNIDNGQCLISYLAHNGSVNSIRFHPTEPLVCTGSGDGNAHIWKIPPLSDVRSRSPQGHSDSPAGSGEEEPEEDGETTDNQQVMKIKNCSVELAEHEGPIAVADWWANGSQVVTASWDRTVKLWDVEKKSAIHTLEGHELEITHASTHSSQKLIVTSSQDTTFRLWDFRMPNMHSVNVFQGHTETVTSAVFTLKADHVVSGSDDRTVKVWDLKNMRSPLATIRLDSAVNRLSLSPNQNIIAIPHDNRHVRLYDLAGNRLSRLPRRHHQGHQRLVCATCWHDDTPSKQIHLLTAGFDKQVLGWSMTA